MVKPTEGHSLTRSASPSRIRTGSTLFTSASPPAGRPTSRCATTPPRSPGSPNLGCIDLHTWRSRVDDVERPDELLIDLDPSEANPWSSVQRIALVVKEVIDELGLASFPKTSGATGLHILCPIRPELRFPDVRDFAKALAGEVERRIDDQSVATTTWKVADRRGVFVDYGQNARDRTIASAYSIRPTSDARASAPLSWDEVAEVDPARFTLRTMRERVATVGDPSAGMWRRKVSLLPRFETLGLTKPVSG